MCLERCTDQCAQAHYQSSVNPIMWGENLSVAQLEMATAPVLGWEEGMGLPELCRRTTGAKLSFKTPLASRGMLAASDGSLFCSKVHLFSSHSH